MSLGLLLVAPALLALYLYPLDLPLGAKLAITSVMVGFVVVFAPLQSLSHAWLLHHGTLLYMPLLFMAFGLLLPIIAIVALYAWAMTWTPGEERRA
jgi:hypothetical protein